MDYNATTPVDRRVVEEMLPYFTDNFGNPASIDHLYGMKAAEAIEKARERIAALIRARADEIVFTSGATESDNLAIQGIAHGYAQKGKHMITCVTEHKAVLDTFKHLERLGWCVTYVPVDKHGIIDLQKLQDAITKETVMISVMYANNEIGTIAPINEIGKIARENEIYFHTDAAQAVGHIPIDVNKERIDLMSISAHKVYGPKGVGALFVRKDEPRVKPSPMFFGGGHERGIRSGTLNVPSIVGFGRALEIAGKEMRKEASLLGNWTRTMRESFIHDIDGAEQNGHPTQRLPHNLNMYFPQIESKALIQAVLPDIALSAGSACTTMNVEPSYVVTALGFTSERAHSSIRFGLGRLNTEEEIEFVIQRITSIVERLRRIRI